VRRRLSRSTLLVAAILAAALAIRLIEVERTAYRPINDAGSYLALASQIANGGSYSDDHRPGAGAGGTRGPSAYFPPGYPYFLAAVDLLDGHTATSRIHGHTRIPGGAVRGARIANAVLGTVTVALVGLVALEGLGGLVALIALAIAAFYPVFIGLSGTIVAENLATPLLLASLWSALRALRAPAPYRWLAAAGVLGGLAVLSHVNAIIMLVPLILISWRIRPSPVAAGRRRLAVPALAVACLLVTLTPWLVRDAVSLHRFVFVTDETGITLVGTYNSTSASSRPVPYKWRIYYGIPAEQALIKQAPTLTEAQLSGRLQSRAFHYISDHPFSVVTVAYDNSRRLLELEGSFAWRASAAAISEPDAIAHAGVISFWVLALVALAGVFTGLARRAWRWLALTPALLWLSVVLINAETPRFREPIDPFLIMLAACALAAAAQRLRPELARAPVARACDVGALPAGAGERVEVVQRLS
jgi:4-amino-4-deoxy-L-arabinose transferase-like glycosyltransferase